MLVRPWPFRVSARVALLPILGLPVLLAAPTAADTGVAVGAGVIPAGASPAGSVPAGAASSGPHADGTVRVDFVQIDGDVFRLETRHDGATPFRGSPPAPVRSSLWRLDQPPPPHLESAPSPSGRPTVRRLEPADLGSTPLYWRRTLTWTLDETAGRSRVEIVVGRDRLVLRGPRRGAPTGAAVLDVDVNGRHHRLPGTGPVGAGVGGARRGDADRRLAALEADFHDPAGFLREYRAFRGATDGVPQALTHIPLPGFARTDPGGECVLPCLGCSGSMLALAANWVALVAACGSVPVSAGLTTGACLATLLAHEGAVMITFAACAGCAVCIDQLDEQDSGTDPPCCRCGQDPNCICQPECGP